MKKLYIFTIVCIIMLSAMTQVTAQVPIVDTSEKIYDYADLFTDATEIELYNEISWFIEDNIVDFVLITTNDLSADYAYSFYTENHFGADDSNSGVLLFINMTDRDIVIITEGYANYAMGGATVDYIREKITPSLTAGNYYEAVMLLLENADYYIKYYDNYTPSTPGGEPLNIIDTIRYTYFTGMLSEIFGYGAIIGLIGGIIILIIMLKFHNKSMQSAPLNIYFDKSGLKVTKRTDRFLRTNTTKVAIPKNTSSGGGGGSRPSGGGTTISRGKF